MSTGNNAALTTLHQAIELEIEGQRFYLKAAECTTDHKGAEMFRSLADDEVIHERILRRQIDALTQGEGWVPVLSPALSEVEGEAEGCDNCGEKLGPNPVRRGEKVYCCEACAFEAQRSVDCGGRSDSTTAPPVVEKPER